MKKILATAFFILQGCLALYEREKGLRDWKIETLGVINSVEFIEETQLAFVLSDDPTLFLFNLEDNEIVWKKKLENTEGEGRFGVKQLSRNLLVYSSKRALMLNSRGHVIYEF